MLPMTTPRRRGQAPLASRSPLPLAGEGAKPQALITVAS